MFESQQSKIEQSKKMKIYNDLIWTGLKIVVAVPLIYFFDYGIYIVIGYLLYSLESNSSRAYINSEEANLHLNTFNERISKLETANPSEGLKAGHET